MAWTNEMIDQLKQMWKKGSTTNEIAKELGVSKNSIIGKVHRLNLTARPSPIKKKSTNDAVPTQQSTPKAQSVNKTEKKHENKDLKQQKIAINPLEVNVQQNACLKLSELDSHTCRWPIGDPKDDNFCFCGKKVRAGQTYCDEHSAVAYVKPGKKEK